MMSGMHPALAGLIGAGVAFVVCLFAYLLVRGKQSWRHLEAQRMAAKASREPSWWGPTMRS